jgi:phosphatidate cytidylyltransferase
MGGAAALYPTALLMALATLAFGAFAADPRSGGRASVWGVAGLVAVAAPGSHLLLLADHAERFALFAFLFLVVCGGDAFAELAGRRWPLRRGILPASPNKTLGGLLGGLAAALAIAVAVNRALGLWSGAQAAAFGLALALAGSLGDLVASSMKRALDIKDFGSSLPRHGGVLDRFDSLIFAAVPYCWMTGG